MADTGSLSLYSSHMAHPARAYPSFATRSITSLPWMGCLSIAWLPPAFHQASVGQTGTVRDESFAQLQHIDQPKSRA